MPYEKKRNLKFSTGLKKPKVFDFFPINHKQGRIHGNPVADGWAGAVMQKPLGIQKCDGRTDGPTDRHGKV